MLETRYRMLSRLWRSRNQILALVVLVFCVSSSFTAFRMQAEYLNYPSFHDSSAIAPIYALGNDAQHKTDVGMVHRNSTMESTIKINDTGTTNPIIKAIGGDRNASVQPREHPHAGARSSDGSWGYVADVTRIRKWMLGRYKSEGDGKATNPYLSAIEPPLYYLPLSPGEEMDAVCNTPPREGSEKKGGWRLLVDKVVVDGPDPSPVSSPYNAWPTNTRIRSLTATKDRSRSNILCAIYTYEKKHPQLKSVAETWGWRCDGFFAASTKTVDDPSQDGYGAIHLPHEGPESYDNMWQKTRSILSYMHDNYLEDYDYFYLSGDDTHLIVENLRNVLDSMSVDPNTPLYLGQSIPLRSLDRGEYFIGGGPGYVLNRATLRMAVQHVLPHCQPHRQVSSEDRFLGDCLREVGIVGNHSVDAIGAQRFHGMTPHFVATSKGNKGYFELVYKFWGNLYGFKTGMNLTSSQSVAFHLLRNPTMLKRHHAILYRSCPQGTRLGDFLLGNLTSNS